MIIRFFADLEVRKVMKKKEEKRKKERQGDETTTTRQSSKLQLKVWKKQLVELMERFLIT